MGDLRSQMLRDIKLAEEQELEGLEHAEREFKKAMPFTTRLNLSPGRIAVYLIAQGPLLYRKEVDKAFRTLDRECEFVVKKLEAAGISGVAWQESYASIDFSEKALVGSVSYTASGRLGMGNMGEVRDALKPLKVVIGR